MTAPTPNTLGPRCTITIEQGEAGVLIAVDFGGPLETTDPRQITQKLALEGLDAIQARLATLRAAAEPKWQRRIFSATTH